MAYFFVESTLTDRPSDPNNDDSYTLTIVLQLSDCD